MTKLNILVAPHPTLKRPATPVGEADDRLRRLMDDMLETMYEAPGIGLAAPQIGVSRRIVVVDTSEEKDEPLRLIDPVLSWVSDEQVTAEEGCLSLPGQYADVTRPERVMVSYRDEHGQQQELSADGITARCLQHEIDHLDGILFVDHLSVLKRRMIMRKLAKQLKTKA